VEEVVSRLEDSLWVAQVAELLATVLSSAETRRETVQRRLKRHPSLQQQKAKSPLLPRRETPLLKRRSLLPRKSKSQQNLRPALALVQKTSLAAPKERQRRRKPRRKLKRQREKSQMVSRLLKNLKGSLKSLVSLSARMATQTI
jgi:hypothetical protein